MFNRNKQGGDAFKGNRYLDALLTSTYQPVPTEHSKVETVFCVVVVCRYQTEE